jgi:hypothetical protein
VRPIRATLLLTGALLRRMLREGMVRRSLLWPTALTACTLLLTLLVMSWLRSGSVVGTLPSTPDVLVQDLKGAGFALIVVEDPDAALRSGRVWAATDGQRLWVQGDDPDLPGAVKLESIVRLHAKASWRPHRDPPLPKAGDAADSGRTITRLLAVLFSLYGVVFGLGMVSRDRDDGTLAAELALPVPGWVPGAARWLAGSAVVAAFYGLCALVFDALIGVPDIGAVIRNGAAAGATATAIGLGTVGKANLRASFAAPFAFGMTLATGLSALGAFSSELGRMVPIASVFTESDGWIPLLGAAAAGVLATLAFWARAARE